MSSSGEDEFIFKLSLSDNEDEHSPPHTERSVPSSASTDADWRNMLQSVDRPDIGFQPAQQQADVPGLQADSRSSPSLVSLFEPGGRRNSVDSSAPGYLKSWASLASVYTSDLSDDPSTSATELIERRTRGTNYTAMQKERLIYLCKRFDNQFNMFRKGSYYIFDDQLMKQTRNGIKLRYIIVFSDYLLICKDPKTPEAIAPDAPFHANHYKIRTADILVQPLTGSDTDFKLYSGKGHVFVTASKDERDAWMKRLNDAKAEAQEYGHRRACKRLLVPCTGRKGAGISNVSSNNHLETASLGIRYPKVRYCMTEGCMAYFSGDDYMDHLYRCCRCNALICFYCLHEAPIRIDYRYERSNVCIKCYMIIAGASREGFAPTLFMPPLDQVFSDDNVLARNTACLIMGTIFLQNKNGDEIKKWGRLAADENDILVLCYYDTVSAVQPIACLELLMFTLEVEKLDNGSRLFKLRRGEIDDVNSVLIHFRVKDAEEAERWYKALKDGLEPNFIPFDCGNYLEEGHHSPGSCRCFFEPMNVSGTRGYYLEYDDYDSYYDDDDEMP